jgi:hypothetical protein
MSHLEEPQRFLAVTATLLDAVDGVA